MAPHEQLLLEQGGVVARSQLFSAGLSDNDVRRLLRRRDLVKVHPAIYVNHTGPLTWHHKAWAGVLHAWPAALSHDSALRAHDGPGRSDRGIDGPIHVAISNRRTLLPPSGIVIHRMADLDARVQWNRSPPRLRVEEAVISVATEAVSDLDAISVLAQSVSSRRTTAQRLLNALADRQRISRRAFLKGVLVDVADGTCSVLEHGYLNRVERPHGLPVAVRQAHDPRRGSLYRDVLYEEFGQIVELDGRIFHTGPSNRDRDLARDLDAAANGLAGVRLGWGQVFERPCQTARRIGAVLTRRGWTGRVTSCARCAGQG